MLLSKTISRAEKLSGKKIQTNGVNQHWVNYKGYTVSFYPNGRIDADTQATGFYTKKIGVDDDMREDYFAGTFHDNITQCFSFINRLVPDYRITWEMNLIYKMEELGEMTTSDAQGQLMIREDLADALFAKDATPTEAAKIILDSCTIEIEKPDCSPAGEPC